MQTLRMFLPCYFENYDRLFTATTKMGFFVQKCFKMKVLERSDKEHRRRFTAALYGTSIAVHACMG